jgi:DNA polymerase-3 subunit chi
MTKIDFYVLPEDGSLTVEIAIGRLAEKASNRGHHVFIQTQNERQTQLLDDALWHFRSSSFVPHARAGDADIERVILGHEDPPLEYNDVLINLSNGIPKCFSRFERLAEIVTHNDAAITTSREAWRFYRDRGYPLAKHELQTT